jgi:putative ATP-dependent endonuclease of OLD family
MHISSLNVSGFRNFDDKHINFESGVNVIIGHNNAGKSNLLKSLSLILDSKSSKRLEIDDFNKNIDLQTLQNTPPSVKIILTISESEGEELTSDDLVTVSNWLIKLESPYAAQLTYEFFLPEGELLAYQSKLQHASELKDAWGIIKHDFLRKYVYKIFGGDPSLKSVADAESIDKFDYQFLNAIRDVERDMFTGKNTLLREIVDFFIDYEIKNSDKTSEEKKAEIKKQQLTFSTSANSLLKLLQDRMKHGEGHILKYAQDTGASFNDAEPGFDGTISEAELYSTLRLIIKYSTGIEIPATHNGLGYNNLIYMSLLLAKMQVDTNGNYLGSNAKVFPILVIEEPEAHLHPSMQYKFLKFLKENVKDKARQVFITSHSTHITSAVSLNEIICLSHFEGELHIGYPGKVFKNDDAGKKSKAFVQRFLDATRSDMLFAKSVILVEGTAEQLLMSTFARCNSQSLENSHVAVVNIGGRYFDHFLQLFDILQPNTIHKKVSCVTDMDPIQKKPGERAKKCYPFEVNASLSYTYSENATANIAKYIKHPSIRFFSQDVVRGKTLEYELALQNAQSSLLLTESISNVDELTDLVNAITNGDDLNKIDAAGILRESDENTRIMNGLKSVVGKWTKNEIVEALFASRYLNSVGKGENALELSVALEGNLEKTSPDKFNIPSYIKDAITWVC